MHPLRIFILSLKKCSILFKEKGQDMFVYIDPANSEYYPEKWQGFQPSWAMQRHVHALIGYINSYSKISQIK